MPTFDLMPLLPHVVVAATGVELAALGALAYLLGRARAERRAAEGAVEALRADLGRLLEEAESRARARGRARRAGDVPARAPRACRGRQPPARGGGRSGGGPPPARPRSAHRPREDRLMAARQELPPRQELPAAALGLRGRGRAPAVALALLPCARRERA